MRSIRIVDRCCTARYWCQSKLVIHAWLQIRDGQTRISMQNVRYLDRLGVQVSGRTSSSSPTCSHSSGRSISEYSTLYRSNSLKPSSVMLISTVHAELATRLSELSHSLTFCTVNTSGSISSFDQRRRGELVPDKIKDSYRFSSVDLMPRASDETGIVEHRRDH